MKLILAQEKNHPSLKSNLVIQKTVKLQRKNPMGYKPQPFAPSGDEEEYN
jgi:hypothetical protein